MSSKRPVVVAVPRGRTVRPALKHAVAVGAPTGAAYVLVHALATDEAGASEAQTLHDLHRAEQQLRALAGPGAHITTRLVDGPVVDAVVRVAEDAELLVVQRRDHHDPELPVGRSTCCDLAARSHVPVVVVPEEHDDLEHGTVTVGIQVPEHSDVVLEEAMAAAAARGARLRIVHGLWAAGGLGEYLVEQSTADRHLVGARTAVEAAVARTRTRWPGLPVEGTSCASTRSTRSCSSRTTPTCSWSSGTTRCCRSAYTSARSRRPWSGTPAVPCWSWPRRTVTAADDQRLPRSASARDPGRPDPWSGSPVPP